MNEDEKFSPMQGILISAALGLMFYGLAFLVLL